MTPIFGWFYIEIAFGILNHDFSQAKMWILFTLLLGVGAFIATYTYKVMFGVIGENLTYGVRQKLFRSLIYKHVGWFDVKKHSTGTLTTLLSEDVQALNGASTEGLGA